MDSICFLFYGIGAFFIILGFYRGMMKMLVTVLGIVLTFYLVSVLAPEWEIVLNKKVYIYENIGRIIEDCALSLPPQIQELISWHGGAAEFVLKVIAYVSMYVIISVVIKLISWLVLKLVQLPGLHFLNSLAGGVLGMAQGVIALWVLFLIITICYGTAWGHSCYCAIQEDSFLSMLYDYNLLLYLWWTG